MAGAKVQFFLSVCDNVTVPWQGKVFNGGHQGEIDVEYTIIDGDRMVMAMDELGHHPMVGDASDIKAISIRKCANNLSITAIYNDPMKNVMGCCTSCSNGCSVYGSSGCACT